MLGQALDGVARNDYCLVGAVGHDFYEGAGATSPPSFPRFRKPGLRGPGRYASYLRMAAERSLGGS